MSREEFEKLPEIATHLAHGNVFYSEEKNVYVSEFSALHFVACYVSGAWMVWQEQQKRLEEYELVADSLDDLYQHERTKNKELQRRIEELELMHSEEKRILHNVIDIERNKNQRVEQ